jgi:hypothetical protein
MRLQKTQAGRDELKPGNRTLNQKERSALLMADGTRTIADLRRMFETEADPVITRLLTNGFLEGIAPSPNVNMEPKLTSDFGKLAGTESRPGGVSGLGALVRNILPSKPPSPELAFIASRQFLLDTCERDLHPHDPDTASNLVDYVKSCEELGMLEIIALQVFEEIEKYAGQSYAETIAWELAELLPRPTSGSSKNTPKF